VATAAIWPPIYIRYPRRRAGAIGTPSGSSR